jgi:hypothetical protein
VALAAGEKATNIATSAAATVAIRMGSCLMTPPDE